MSFTKFSRFDVQWLVNDIHESSLIMVMELSGVVDWSDKTKLSWIDITGSALLSLSRPFRYD